MLPRSYLIIVCGYVSIWFIHYMFGYLFILLLCLYVDITVLYMQYDVILICSYYSCLKTHMTIFIILFSSPHLAIFSYVIHRSLALTTEPSDIGGMNELINKLLCLN